MYCRAYCRATLMSGIRDKNPGGTSPACGAGQCSFSVSQPNEPDSPYTSSRSRLCRKIHNVCSMLLEHHYSALVLVLRPGGMVYGAGGRGPRPAPGARACGLRRVLRVPRTAAIAVLRHTDTARTLATETHLIRVLCNCQVTAKCAIPVATAERRFCGHCRLFWILGIVHIACHTYRRMAAPCNCKHARPAKPEPSDDRESHPRRTPMSRG